jgi:hypothetical protein
VTFEVTAPGISWIKEGESATEKKGREHWLVMTDESLSCLS